MGFFKSFNPFKAIQRFVTITPKSFSGNNIAKAVSNTIVMSVPGAAISPYVDQGVRNAATAGTAGIFDFTKNRVNVPFSGAQVNAGTLSTIDTLTSQNTPPQVKNFLYSPTGRTVATGIGAVGAAYMGNVASSAIAPPQGSVTTWGVISPEGASYFSAQAISGVSGGYAASTFGQTVMQVFGRQTGAAILQIFSGDFVGAYRTLSTDLTPIRNPNLFASYGPSGGGGSGLGVSPGGYSGQSSLSPIWYPIMGLGILGLVWFLRRK